METIAKENSKKSLNWKFLLLLSTGYLALSVNQQGFLALLPFVREEFILTRAQAGLYTTFFFMSATAIAIFSGRMVDLLGSKGGMLLGVGSVGFFMLLHAMAPTYYFLLVLAFMMGAGFSVITPAVTKGVMVSVPPRKRAMSMGIMQSGGGIGGFAGASLLPALGGVFGWRIAVLASAIFALLIMLVIQILYKEGSQEGSVGEQESGEGEEEESLGFKQDFLILIRNRKLLWVCGLGASFGMAFSSVVSHFTIYLSQDLEMSMTLAGLGLGVLQIGGLLGRPCWGWFSDRVFEGDRRRSMIAMSLSICFMSFVFGLFITGPDISRALLMVLSFILGLVVLSPMTLLFTATAELAGEESTGMVVGLALIFSRTGVLVSPPLFGWVADLRGIYDYSWMLLGTVCMIFTVVFALGTRHEW